MRPRWSSLRARCFIHSSRHRTWFIHCSQQWAESHGPLTHFMCRSQQTMFVQDLWQTVWSGWNLQREDVRTPGSWVRLICIKPLPQWGRNFSAQCRVFTGMSLISESIWLLINRQTSWRNNKRLMTHHECTWYRTVFNSGSKRRGGANLVNPSQLKPCWPFRICLRSFKPSGMFSSADPQRTETHLHFVCGGLLSHHFSGTLTHVGHVKQKHLNPQG